VVWLGAAWTGVAQTLNVPPRPANAPNGTPFTNIVPTLSRDERVKWVYAQVISGNVAGWLRAWKPISVSAAGHTATYHVIPDYPAIGTDGDCFLEPTTPLLAQRLGDQLGYTLPARKMVIRIWTNAAGTKPTMQLRCASGVTDGHWRPGARQLCRITVIHALVCEPFE